MPKVCNTREAAGKIGVSFRTLNRWIATGRIEPSQHVPMGAGRKLWLWSQEDIDKGRHIRATLKPGVKPKGKGK
jgi:hypothetical protein